MPQFFLLPLRYLAPCLVLCLSIAGCRPDESARYVVLSRLGGTDAVNTRPALEVVRTDFGTENRFALKVTPDSSFEVEVDARIRRVFYAVAVRGGKSGLKHYFAIEQRQLGSWQPVSSLELDGKPEGWRDDAVDLGEASGTTRTLRFKTSSEGPQAGAPAELFWGSVAFAALDGELSRADAQHLSDPPNVILLSLDTLGARYLDFLEPGPDAKNSINGFLDSSFAFRRAYVQYPNTLVSHASLFSALYPVHHGIYPGSQQPLNSLVEILAQHGYLTAAFSENGYIASSLGFAAGFDRYSDGRKLEGFAGDAQRTFADATRWLEEFGRGTRFFLFVHTYEVHAPYAPRDDEALALAHRLTPDDERILHPRLLMQHNFGRKSLDKRDLARLRALYVGEIEYLDRQVGEFLRQLAVLGIERDTLVILTSDHGEQFGEGGNVGHGHNLHNTVLHVPLGFRWPGRIVNAESQVPVQLIDVLPTVLDLIGIPTPQDLDGHSLATALLGSARDPVERPVFTELLSSAGECLIHTGARSCRLGRYAVQTGRYKLVSSEIPLGTRLYDLDADPSETLDVSSEQPKELARHEALLANYLASSTAQPHKTDHGAEDLVGELRERLRSLGYVE